MRRIGWLAIVGACTGGKGSSTDSGTSRTWPTYENALSSDTDTDADADTDTDTDADTDATGDTGVATSPWTGTYAGTVDETVTYQATPSGPLFLLECTGPLTVVADPTATPFLQGAGTCTTADLSETWNVDLTGDVTTDPQAAGNLVANHPTYAFSDAWAGGFATDTLTGSGSGDNGGGYPQLTWSFDFSVTR